MRLTFILRLGLLLFLTAEFAKLPAQEVKAPYDAVNPFIGTAGGGNTFPGATVPFGMVQWSPDTNQDAWYHYNEPSIRGFSMAHLSGAGCPLYGDFAILPVKEELTSSPGTDMKPYQAPFSHAAEEAHPGYYAVTLENGARVELTVTEHAGIARVTFPKGTPARLLLNSGSSVDALAGQPESKVHALFGNRIRFQDSSSYTESATAGGFCGTPSHYTIYGAGRFSKPYLKKVVWRDGETLQDAQAAEGKHTGAWLDFGEAGEILLKVGLSYVNEEAAARNLESEIPGWNFEEVRAGARSTWTRMLSKIELQGGTPEQRTNFYTATYHSLLAPNIFSDVDGRYIGFDQKVHQVNAPQKAQYANFSDWDIYRCTVQWQALLDADRSSDMMQSLVNDAEQAGSYPRWPAANDTTYVMGGDSPPILIASSYAFGAHRFDTRQALAYMVKSGTTPGLGINGGEERPFLDPYLRLGYVPTGNDHISASHTLEYASADFATAQFAKALGQDETARAFLKQSGNWRNLFDPQTRWIRPRTSGGAWLDGFDPEHSLPKRGYNPQAMDQEGFEEGNTSHYTLMIPFDYPALFARIGGDEAVVQRLDRFFLKLRCWTEPCFNMENEPDFVAPYTYVFAGQPWKTQQLVARIAKETFKAAPDGLPGNDDLGATSNVYTWNSLGMYPAVPGIGGVVLGAPMFERAVLHLAGNRTLEILRQGGGPIVQSISLNGKRIENYWVSMDSLHSGENHMVFVMTETQPARQFEPVSARPPVFRQE